MADAFDVVVIGAGPGGYIAAIRAAQLGFKTACIDDWSRAGGKPAPGGTCTNVGCIPSKALQSSENFEHAHHAFGDHGIEIKGLAIDVAKMLARKDKVVGQNNDGILYLFKKNKVTFFHGRGSFAGKEGDAWKIAVEAPAATQIVAKHVIVATGSKPRALPGVAMDNDRVLDNESNLVRNTGALPGARPAQHSDPTPSLLLWGDDNAGNPHICRFDWPGPAMRRSISHRSISPDKLYAGPSSIRGSRPGPKSWSVLQSTGNEHRHSPAKPNTERCVWRSSGQRSVEHIHSR